MKKVIIIILVAMVIFMVVGVGYFTFTREFLTSKRNGVDLALATTTEDKVTVTDDYIDISPSDRDLLESYSVSDFKYFKDSHNVYISSYGKMHVLEGADPSTFSIDIKTIDKKNYYFEFAQDKNYIFFRGDKTTFSPDFVLIDPGSRKDCGGSPYVLDFIGGERAVFVAEFDSNGTKFVRIDGVDVDTFEVLWSGYSKDKNNVYLKSGKTEFDPKTFDAEKARAQCPIG